MLPYAPWLIWIFPFTGSVLTFALPPSKSRLSHSLAVASIGLSALFSLSMIPDILAGIVFEWRVQWIPFDIAVLVDPLNVLMACVVSVVGLVVALFSVGYMQRESDIVRFWFLVQLFIGGYLLIVLSGDLLLTFIGWELVGASCMALASFYYQDEEKARIGLKTGILLRIGDLALLASILGIYVFAGTFNLTELQQSTDWMIQMSQSGVLLLMTLLFLMGVLVKAAQFPLQEWLPDMLAASPSCFNALTECLAGPFLLARVLPLFHNAYLGGIGELMVFFLATAWLGILSALITALIATTQTNIYKILACSVSSVIGIMLTALGLAPLSQNMGPGFLAGTFLLTVDACITGLLFLTAAFITYVAGSDTINRVKSVHSKLAHRCMEVGVFAMIGVPPLSGFWCSNWIQTVALNLADEAGKLGQTLIQSSSSMIFYLLLITGGVTAFYGLRMMWLTLSHQGNDGDGPRIHHLMRRSLTFMLVITIAIDFLVPVLIPVFNRFFFPIVHKPFLTNVFEVGHYIVPTTSTILSLIVCSITAYIAYLFYGAKKYDPLEWTTRHPILKLTYRVLLNRLYCDTIYTTVARSLVSTTSLMKQYMERRIDMLNYIVSNTLLMLARGVVQSIENTFTSASNRISTQILSTAFTGYKFIELEGLSQRPFKGFNELYESFTQNVTRFSQHAYNRIEVTGSEALTNVVTKAIRLSSSNAYNWIEVTGSEALTNVVTKAIRLSSSLMRGIHTGILSYNMLLVLLGLVLLIVLLALGGS